MDKIDGPLLLNGRKRGPSSEAPRVETRGITRKLGQPGVKDAIFVEPKPLA